MIKYILKVMFYVAVVFLLSGGFFMAESVYPNFYQNNFSFGIFLYSLGIFLLAIFATGMFEFWSNFDVLSRKEMNLIRRLSEIGDENDIKKRALKVYLQILKDSVDGKVVIIDKNGQEKEVAY